MSEPLGQNVLFKFMYSLRGRFTVGVVVITLALLLIPVLGNQWFKQLNLTLEQVARQTAPASSLAAQSAHTSAQLIAEIEHLIAAQDQYARQNAYFGITQRATLLLDYLRQLEAATGKTHTSMVMAETAAAILSMVNQLNQEIAELLLLHADSPQAIGLRDAIQTDAQRLARLSRVLSIHANRVVNDSKQQLNDSVAQSLELLTTMRRYAMLLIFSIIAVVCLVGYVFLARSLVGHIVHLATLVKDMRAPDLPRKLGHSRLTEFAHLEAAIAQLHHLLKRLDEQSSALQVLADEREQAHQRALRQSLTDPLTQVSNRRHLFQAWEELPLQGVKSEDQVAVLTVDLDHFKQINDRYGHAAGDAVLIEAASRLKHGVGDKVLLARIGGEEFVLVLVGKDAQTAMLIAEQLRQVITARPCLGMNGQFIPLTVSIGVSVASYAYGHLDQLLSQADTALYQAKAAGRNCVKMYEHTPA